MKKQLILALAGLGVVGTAGLAQAGVAYTVGDVFVAATGSGSSEAIDEYTATGTLVQSFNGGALSSYLTGMAFQNNGDLLVTDFGAGKVVQYDGSGNLLNSTWATGISSPESIAIDSSGNVYVSSVGGTGITEYGAGGGAPTSTTLAGTRTDWIDLASDQHTMLYTDESGIIHSANVSSHTSNPNFSSLGGQYALRIIGSGTFAGDVLAANSSSALLINSTGTAILQHYSWAGNNGSDFALNIDPNGTSFWTADTSGHIAEFDIATGTLQESWTAANTGGVYGLVVFGQQTASGGGGGGGGGSVPEPSALALLGAALLGLGLMSRRGLSRRA